MKTIKSNYLYFISLLLIIIGLVALKNNQAWWLIPSVIGLIILLVCLTLKAKIWQRKYAATQAEELLKTLAVLTILALINFLAFTYFSPLDLTENQLFTLSPQTQEILKNLSQPLKVWLFEQRLSKSDQQLLENYQSHSSFFSFEVVNPEINLDQAKTFGFTSKGEVFLEYGNKKKRLEKTNLTDNLSEDKLTNTIIAIQRDRPLNIYFLIGHGEPSLNNSQGGFSNAIAALKSKGYVVKSLNLAQTRKPIPSDCNLVVLAGAVKPLLPPEIKFIKDYLDSGGNFLLMSDPRTNLGIEGILKNWGIQLDNRLVIDDSGFGSTLGYGPATAIITDYGQHPITANFRSGISLYPMTRAISTTKVDNIEAVALLITNPRSWAESNLTNDQATFNPKEDIKGPLDIGVALKRTFSEKNKTLQSKLVIFGNSTFATNGWFQQQLNSDVLNNAIAWLTEEQPEPLTIGPKQPINRRLNLDQAQENLIFWLAVVIIPLFGFFSAFVVWFLRR